MRKRQHAEVSRVTFADVIERSDMSFDQFEQHPEAAIMLQLLNSGYEKYRDIDFLNDGGTSDSDSPDFMSKIKAEINDEILSPTESYAIAQHYLASQGRGSSNYGPALNHNLHTHQGFDAKSIDTMLLTCGACGLRDAERGQNFRHCLLSELSILSYTAGQLEEYEAAKEQPPLLLPSTAAGTLKQFHLHKLRSAYTSHDLDTTFHLHPEMIHLNADNKESTFLCTECSKACFPAKAMSTEQLLQDKESAETAANKRHEPRIPCNSIADGMDLGDFSRIGLQLPDLADRMLIARQRHYHNVVKISGNNIVGFKTDSTQNKLRGHSVMFKHSAPIVAALALLMLNAEQNIDRAGNMAYSIMSRVLKIQFVGPDNELDRIASNARMNTAVQAQPHVVYQWLSVLRHVHPAYSDDPILPPYQAFKTAIQKCNNALIDNADRISDQAILSTEKTQGSDIAQIRARILDDQSMSLDDATACAGGETEDMNMTFAYVTDTNEQTNQLTDKERKSEVLQHDIEYIHQIAEAFNVNIGKEISAWQEETGAVPYLPSSRDYTPMNEFRTMHEILVETFPHIFLLGNSHLSSKLLSAQAKKAAASSLTNKSMQHLLFQYTCHAAKDRDLLFYLYDVMLRHSVMRNLSAKIRSNPDAFHEYASMLNSDDMKTKIKAAARNPGSKAAKEVIAEVLPFMTFGSQGKNISSSFTDTQSVTRAIAMTNRYGSASAFITITPDDVSNPTSFRMSFRSKNNRSFPAAATNEIYAAMLNGTSIKLDASEGSCDATFEIPTNYKARMEAAHGNPVAVAREFQAMIENVMTTLIGCPPDFQSTNESRRKTFYYKSKDKASPRQKGIFGYVTAFFGMIETQQRGALHFHFLIWGGITPKLMEGSSHIEQLWREVQAALDAMYSAEIPRSSHVEDYLVREMKKSRHGRSFVSPNQAPQALATPPCPNSPNWDSFFQKCITRTGIHEHCWTCKKPPTGSHGCRGGKPSGMKLETGPSELCWKEGTQADSCLEKKIVLAKQPVSPPQQPPLGINTPISELDDRVIAWELKRPPLETLPTVPTNFILHNALSSDKNDRISHRFCQRTGIDQVVSDNPQDTRSISLDHQACMLVDPNDDNDHTAERSFCLTEIYSAMNPSTVMSKEHESVMDWLSSLSTNSIKTIYADLSKQLPGRNGFVVETNKTLANLTGASTNCVLLGNTQQSAASLFYIAQYICKNKAALESCLLTLSAAQAHIDKYPSTAEDTGTPQRTVQHLFTRLLNQLHSHVEISDTQVALGLLNMGNEVTSDTFAFFGAEYSLNLVKFELDLNKQGKLLRPGITAKCLEKYSSGDISPEFAKCGSLGTAPFYEVRKSCLQNEDQSNDGDFDFDETEGQTLKVPVYYPMHYRWRGKDLVDITRNEYYAIVGIKPLPKEAKKSSLNNPKGSGRLASRIFRFDTVHPLHESHCQYLKSKQSTLIFNGWRPKKPPAMPLNPYSNDPNVQRSYDEDIKAWNVQADQYALFALVCFRPETSTYLGTQTYDPDMFSWDAFCSWTQEMKDSKRMVDRLRLDAMYTYLYRHRSKAGHRDLFTQYRLRDRTIWSDCEKTDIARHFQPPVIRNSQGPNGDGHDDDEHHNETKCFKPQQIKNLAVELAFCQSQTTMLENIFGKRLNNNTVQTNDITIDGDSCMPDLLEEPSTADLDIATNIDEATPNRLSATSNIIRNGFKDKSEEKYAGMLKEQNVPRSSLVEQEDPLSTANLTAYTINYHSEPEFDIDAFIQSKKLASQQESIVRQVANYFEELGPAGNRAEINPPQPLNLLLTGEPGTGKSYVIDTLTELTSAMNAGSIACSSFNGIAAVNINGTTILRLLHIGTTKENRAKELEEGTIQTIRHNLDAENLCLFIIDEISTLDAPLIAAISRRLQQIMNNPQRHFGGIAMIFVGDFNQLGPVQKTFLPQDMMEWAKSRDLDTDQAIIQRAKENKYMIGGEVDQGCCLFSKFIRIHLDEQQRAAEDPEHIQFVTNLSNGIRITYEALRQYKVLAENDVSNASAEWAFAPILVMSNRERLNVTRNKCFLYAQINKTYVFKWKCHQAKWQNKPQSKNQLNHDEEQNAFFWQYFVPGAEAYITLNVNNYLAIANGTAARCHSLSFTCPIMTQKLHKLLNQEPSLPFGTEIQLNEAPFAVNLEISHGQEGKTSISKQRLEKLEILQKYSILEDKIVIPILQAGTMTKMHDKWKQYTFKTRSLWSPMCAVSVCQPFPFDLAFAMTVHKAQGRTIERVILSLSRMPNGFNQLNFPAFFVATSRVTKGDHMRLLYSGRAEDLQYLTALRPNKYVVQYYSGFQNSNGIWDPLKAVGKKTRQATSDRPAS